MKNTISNFYIPRSAFRICYRPLAPHEFDWELSIVAFFPCVTMIAWMWIALSLPLPHCILREWTGIPCISCGSTTSFQLLISGQIDAAFWKNPLFFCGMLCGMIAWLFGVVVICLGHKRWRPTKVTREMVCLIRVAVLSILAAAWLYQLL